MTLSIETVFKRVQEVAQLIDLNDYLGDKRARKPKLDLALMASIIIYFNYVGCSSFKRYLEVFIFKKYKNITLSYNRWCFWRKKLSNLIERIAVELCTVKEYRGISLIDSTTVPVCSIQRERDHKVHVKGATKSKGSLGWFYGYKLHLIVSDKGRLLRIAVSSANVHDVSYIKEEGVLTGLSGILIGDSAYQAKGLPAEAGPAGLAVMVKPKKKQLKKQPYCSEMTKLLTFFGKRWRIEGVFATLKRSCHLNHARTARCPESFFVFVFASLIVYALTA